MPKLDPEGILDRLEKDRRDRQRSERRQVLLDRLGALAPDIGRLRKAVRAFEEQVARVEETATRVRAGQDGTFEVDQALEELWYRLHNVQAHAQKLGSMALPADQRPGPGE